MQGRVLQSTGSWYTVKTDNGHVLECRLKGKLRLLDMKTTNPVAVGDKVMLEREDGAHETVIAEVLPRDNYIIRQSPRKKHHTHIIAANIDQALLIVTISHPRTSFGFADRFLVAAACYHIPARIIINKTDLHSEKDKKLLKEWHYIYNKAGYKLLEVSAVSGSGLDTLRDLMRDKVSLLSGHSGVGKSSLINCINPGMHLKVGEISRKWEKGQHTTTFATMHEIFPGAFIIDTPGIKEFALSGIEPAELSGYFPEMASYLLQCRFNTCLHTGEPGCAVLEAVEKGDISFPRYQNYLNILADIQSTNYWERK